MKAITKELIQEYLGTEDKITRTVLGWRIDLVSGASVTLTKKRLDFGKFRDPKNRKDVCEPLFQMEVRDCIRLANAIWGGVRFYGECEPKDYAAVLEYAQSEGLDTGDQGHVFRHFGVDATIKYGWLSYTISVPNRGYAKVDCGAIEKVVGDLLAPAIAMLHEITPDQVVVRGKADLLITAVHCGNTMGITVIPENIPELPIAVLANVSILLFGVIAFQWVDFGYAVLIAYTAGFLLWVLGARIFWKQLRDIARRRGLEIVKPGQFSKSRKASEEEARKVGML